MDILGGQAPQRVCEGLRFGRRTIPASASRSAGFLFRCTCWLALAGCVAAPENGFLRAERERRADAVLTAREVAQRDQAALELSLAEDKAALLPLRDAVADAAQRRREAARALQHEEAMVGEAEAQLAAARTRLAAVQAEAEALRSASAEVETKELRLAALRERTTQLDTELAAAQRDFDAKAAEVQPRVDALRQKLAALAAVAAQIDALLGPAAPAAPATPDAGSAAK